MLSQSKILSPLGVARRPVVRCWFGVWKNMKWLLWSLCRIWRRHPAQCQNQDRPFQTKAFCFQASHRHLHNWWPGHCWGLQLHIDTALTARTHTELLRAGQAKTSRCSQEYGCPQECGYDCGNLRWWNTSKIIKDPSIGLIWFGWLSCPPFALAWNQQARRKVGQNGGERLPGVSLPHLSEEAWVEAWKIERRTAAILRKKWLETTLGPRIYQWYSIILRGTESLRRQACHDFCSLPLYLGATVASLKNVQDMIDATSRIRHVL